MVSYTWMDDVYSMRIVEANVYFGICLSGLEHAHVNTSTSSQ